MRSRLASTDSVGLGAEACGGDSPTLASGESVKLSSFGSFLLRDKRGRVGRNPKTGVEVPIDARRVLVFKPSQVLKERVDSSLSKD